MLQVQALQRSAASGKLIIITGAGTSLALAEPTDPAKNWKQLIGSGLQTAKVKQKITDIQFDRWNETLQSNDMDDLLATAEFVSAKLGGPGGILYSRWLADTFENMKVKLGSERDTFHKIAQRGVPICTLNYDTLLEQATGRQGINYIDKTRTMNWARREEKGILHLHGIWNEPTSCILGIRDDEKAVEDEFREALQRGLTSFNRLLFIGCGDTLSDPNFAALLAWMRKVLQRASLQHYALVRNDEVAEKNADELWHGFIDPVGYGPSYDDLPTFLDSIFGRTLRSKVRGTKEPPSGEPTVLQSYRQFVIRDCGQMTIEGVRADMETAQRKFDLERLFVPLSIEAVPPEIPESDPERTEKIERWKKQYPGPVPFGVAFAKRKSLALLALPGGGETLLLKRLAVAYAEKNRMSLSDDQLPNFDLLPLLIRCREWRDHIRKPIASLLESLPEITGQPKLRGLSSALQPLLKAGRVLLLIDGLDEIHDDADRTIFVENLERFLADYSKIRLVVSSREAGFSLVAPCLMRFCERWRIAPLSEEAISTLSSYWHELMGGAVQATGEEARLVTETLLRNPALRRLAENPLLLTMLLVVKHGAGRLPPDRVSLYDRAVEVLLDTWNIKGHEPLNPREAVPQLAYVAFELMKSGRQTATERELLRIIEECRQNVPMIRRYTKDAPHEFLKRVELRSSLVVEAGHVAEDGKTVPFYQFRHLTFQEYLAAVAAVEGHHPGYTQGGTLLDPLRDVVIADEWKEVIPMAAVLGRKQAQPLIAELVSRGEAVKQEFFATGNFPEKVDWDKLPESISRLVQCLIEEAEFSQETLGQALSLVSFFARGCNSPENWEALSRGPYGDELIHQALIMYVEMDWPRETVVRNTVAVLSAFSRPTSDRLCAEGLAALRASIASPDEKEASLALLTVCGLLVRRSERTVESLLPLLPQIETSAMLLSAPIIEAANWALGLIYYVAEKQEMAVSLPSHSVLDHLTSAWLGETDRTESIRSFALASVLLFPRGSWKPHLAGSERSTLRSYLSRDVHSGSYAQSAAAFIGFHAGDVFSDQEFLSLLRGPFSLDTGRLRSLLEGAGLSLDDVSRTSSARNRPGSRKSASKR